MNVNACRLVIMTPLYAGPPFTLDADFLRAIINWFVLKFRGQFSLERSSVARPRRATIAVTAILLAWSYRPVRFASSRSLPRDVRSSA